VRVLVDLVRVPTIRSAVYITEQQRPYEEKFDGNDFCSVQSLGEGDRFWLSRTGGLYFHVDYDYFPTVG
jgi:hypothetical protein